MTSHDPGPGDESGAAVQTPAVRAPAVQAPAVTTPVLSDTRRDAVEAVTWPVRVASAWTWRLIVLAVGVYLALRALQAVELVAFSIVLALLFTSVLHPVERRLRRVLPGPKSFPAAITLLLGVVVLAAIGWFIAWQITSHSSQLGDQLSAFVTRTKNWLQTGPLKLKQADFDQLTNNITNTIKTHQSDLVNGAIATLQTFAEIAGAALLVLLTTFFMLRDGELIWKWVVSLLPREAHFRFNTAGRMGWRTLGGYMRGTVLIAGFHGISIALVLFILHVPLAAALGVLIFLGSFVPLIGLTVTGAFCVVVALLEHGVTSAIVVAIAIIVLVQVEGQVLQPLIMSRAVEVHPLAVAVSVLAGTALAGIAGALIAVPLVAFLNTAIRALRDDLDDPEASTFPVAERFDLDSPTQPEGSTRRVPDGPAEPA
ncbi:predicted PurR-regulated permease PerM [Jatrophihabitans sp. GAS493]|uniref:AI-2E family transporter n=1 Tax=Jatrophihabitans sp. GAS493 TaxID=1907575 RepID=UPI000BB7BDCD|nr:AI-2E family transporter [Jatrophihabitans sp. GAS493]SOD71242.1 predicted PurR-regulated permease PerM [Jatrophihabitans sp. GAS493]